MKTKIADYKPFNFVDGEGVRCSLYVSGCLFNCKGCYNKCAQDFQYGTDYSDTLKSQILQDIGQSYCQGLSLLGGEPFLHTSVLTDLCRDIRSLYGHSKDIWLWSGYTWEELQEETTDKQELLSYLDILVDGRFVLSQLDLTLQFRGSRNQRIIDVQQSLTSQTIKLWEH
ncbi:anaerobic ribonucleoside-triphosphate reductase activating protein [Carnobacteriaceae bacterium zg-ZUI78]|nr:anaerobic ribonucleoside-triphosphate reductase activating protein [Carnobacteriaceae bacterium zg-ZUI78]